MTYLIIGIILATVGLSLLTGIANTIDVFFELIKSFMAVKIAQCNIKINDLAQTQDESQDVRAIGFTIPTEEDDEDYDY